MKKKIVLCLTILLLAAMIVTVAAGCGGDTGDEGSEATTEPTKAPEGTEEPGEATATPEIVLDMGGRVIRYNAWWNLEPSRGSSEEGDKFVDKIEALQQKNNFTIEYTTSDWGGTRDGITSSVMAGDPMCDVSLIDRRWLYPAYFVNNILTPISDLKYIDLTNSKWNKLYTETGTYKGVCYSTDSGQFFPRGLFYFNKTVFERQNLPNMYDIVNNKQWNWDKLIELATATKIDDNNDGIIDIWGLNGIGMEAQFVLGNNGTIVNFEDGNPVFTLGEPNGLEALQFVQDLKTKLLLWEINPDGAQWDYAKTAFNDGKIAILGGGLWFSDQYRNDMADDYGMVYIPMGPKATEYISVADEYNQVCFPAGIKNPEEVGFFYDRWTEPLPDADPDGWVQTYEGRCRDDESLEILRTILFGEVATRPNDMGYFDGIVNLSYTFFWEIGSGAKTPQSSMEEVTPQAQAILDDLMNSLK